MEDFDEGSLSVNMESFEYIPGQPVEERGIGRQENYSRDQVYTKPVIPVPNKVFENVFFMGGSKNINRNRVVGPKEKNDIRGILTGSNTPLKIPVNHVPVESGFRKKSELKILPSRFTLKDIQNSILPKYRPDKTNAGLSNISLSKSRLMNMSPSFSKIFTKDISSIRRATPLGSEKVFSKQRSSSNPRLLHKEDPQLSFLYEASRASSRFTPTGPGSQVQSNFDILRTKLKGNEKEKMRLGHKSKNPSAGLTSEFKTLDKLEE